LAQFDFGDDRIFTCIGTSGKEPQSLPSPILQQQQQHPQQQPAAASNGGASSPAQMDPESFMNAFKNFMQNMQQQQQQQPGGRQ
jgi:hypothetical protein